MWLHLEESPYSAADLRMEQSELWIFLRVLHQRPQYCCHGASMSSSCNTEVFSDLQHALHCAYHHPLMTSFDGFFFFILCDLRSWPALQVCLYLKVPLEIHLQKWNMNVIQLFKQAKGTITSENRSKAMPESLRRLQLSTCEHWQWPFSPPFWTGIPESVSIKLSNTGVSFYPKQAKAEWDTGWESKITLQNDNDSFYRDSNNFTGQQ